ncbi:MAG: Xaa-Pro peptidase family protein [Pseudomonadota bacterium]
MPLFDADEYARRRRRLDEERRARGLDALLLFAPESHYWLTGYDTFGYCFFQCLIVGEGAPVLLTRSADLRQAAHTSIIEDVRIWKDRAGADPTQDLAEILSALGLRTARLGVEYDTHGLTAAAGFQLKSTLARADLVDASDLVPWLRLTKSDAEIAHLREAARLADLAYDAALATIAPGVSEAALFAAMQGSVLAEGGDYPGNPFIIGSGRDALLCRYKSGRRILGDADQVTLEWAGVSAQYHAAIMRTVVVGPPTARHKALHKAAEAALLASEEKLRAGETMGAVFARHADTLDQNGLSEHRLNACGYAMGISYAPCWMDRHMFYADAATVLAPGMAFFLHMILMDSTSGTAMTLGRSALVTDGAPDILSRHGIELPER